MTSDKPGKQDKTKVHIAYRKPRMHFSVKERSSHMKVSEASVTPPKRIEIFCNLDSWHNFGIISCTPWLLDQLNIFFIFNFRTKFIFGIRVTLDFSRSLSLCLSVSLSLVHSRSTDPNQISKKRKKSRNQTKPKIDRESVNMSAWVGENCLKLMK